MRALRDRFLSEISSKPVTLEDLLNARQRRWLKQGSAAVPELLRRLESTDLKVSEEAAKVLRHIKDPRGLDALIRYSLQHLLEPTGKVKDLEGPGYDHLNSIGKPALPAVTAAYHEQASHPTVRKQETYLELLIELAAGMTSQDPEQPLLEEALNSPFPRVVSEAASQLARIRGPRAYPLLIRLLAPEGRQHILSSRTPYLIGVLEGLQIIGNPDAVERLLDVWIRNDIPPQGMPVPYVFGGKWTLRSGLIAAINSLTGEQMDGDLTRIRAWVEAYKLRPECHPSGAR